MTANVRHRPEREPAVVVVESTTSAYVLGVDPDVLQVLALSAGIAHQWEGIGARWRFDAEDALRVASALRACGRSVRLSSGWRRDR